MKYLILNMSETLRNIYILKASDLYLFLNVFYHNFIAIALKIVCCWYFLENGNFCFATKKFSKST